VAGPFCQSFGVGVRGAVGSPESEIRGGADSGDGECNLSVPAGLQRRWRVADVVMTDAFGPYLEKPGAPACVINRAPALPNLDAKP
jgi:hypothetical protein